MTAEFVKAFPRAAAGIINRLAEKVDELEGAPPQAASAPLVLPEQTDPCDFIGHAALTATNPGLAEQEAPLTEIMHAFDCYRGPTAASREHFEHCVIAALAGSPRPLVSEPPAGWKLVPIEPTAEMIHAMRYEGRAPLDYEAIYERLGGGPWPNFGPDLARRAYQLALAATPALGARPPPIAQIDLRGAEAAMLGVPPGTYDMHLSHPAAPGSLSSDAAPEVEPPTTSPKLD